MRQKLLFMLSTLLLWQYTHAQTIVDVLPLTDRIVVVHFDEGFATHHKRGQLRSQESVTRTVLNIAAATTASTYQVSSTNDANYTTAKIPASINRKSKGTEWALLCEDYNATTGCINNSPDRADEHWLYLTLPTALQRGKTYTINTGSLGSNGSTWSFTYDEKTIRSEAVHVNQIGYKPNAALKYGYVYHWAGDLGGLDLSAYSGKPFWVVNTATNTVAFTGSMVLRKTKLNAETGQGSDTPNQNFSGADVYECDFSALTTPGDYVLAVEGIGSSFRFSIAQTIYAEPFSSVMNGLFKNRSGIAITQGPISDQTRPAPHNPNLTPNFANRLFYSTARNIDHPNENSDDKVAYEAGKKGLINTWGFYQDAGDWDGYPLHARVPINLMFLYENFPTKFSDNTLKLAERNNGTPDLLDEARWLLRFFHRTRHAIQDAGYGTGGVGGARVFGDLWGGDQRADGTVKASWDDTDRDWYVSGEDVWTTYKYAGMAAQFAYCLSLSGTADSEGINWQQEAIDAYAWAKAHQVAADETPRNDYNLSYDRLYSSAMLYRLTGNSTYHEDFKSQFNALNLTGSNLQDDVRFGVWAYTLMPASRSTDATILATIRAKAESAADNLVISTVNRRAARWGGDFSFPMLIGQATTPAINEGFTAYSILKATNPAKANNYLTYITTTADYFLGNNPLNQTWVTGLGERYPKEIFHLDSWYSDEGTTRTGIIPYGPWRTTTPRPPTGWFDLHWPEQSLYPAGMDNWPGHERWYDQRMAPTTGEFTVHQTTINALMAFGLLLAAEEPPFRSGATGVSLNPSSLTLSVNNTATLTATVLPDYVTNRAVSWASSNTAVATVLDGVVTGVATGTATITVTTADGGFIATTLVTVTTAPTVTCEGNRFTNPGFEDANLTGYFSNGDNAIVTDAHTGNSALRLGSSTGAAYANQQYLGPISGTYTFRVWTKKIGTPQYALVQFRFIDAAGNDTGTTVDLNIPDGAAYQELVIGPLTAPANAAKILIGFPVGAGGSVLIDDLCLTEVNSNTNVTTCEGNKFVNTSFEDSNLDAYFRNGDNSIVTDARSGNRALRLGSTTGAGYTNQQYFGPVAGAYTFRVWTKKIGTPQYALVQFRFIDAAGNEIGTPVDLNIPDGAAYQELVIGPVTAPANAAKTLIGFPVGGGGSVLIDDLCLTVGSSNTTVTPVCEGNRFTNSGFEDPNLAAYFRTGDNGIVTDAYSGNSALRLGSSTGVAYTNQQYLGPIAGAYTFRVWTKKIGTPQYALVQFRFIDAAGNETGTPVDLNIPDGAAYQELVIGPLTAPANAAKILIGFPVGAGGSVLIDDLCLTVANPTLVLTSLCSANPALTRRWRIVNTYTTPVNYTWDIYGSTKTGSGTVPAGGTIFFETQTVGSNSPNTLRLSYLGKQTVKASSGATCSPGGRLATETSEGLQVLHVYPNPSDGSFRVRYESPSEETVQVSMVNLLGQPVYRQGWPVSTGQNTLSIEARSLPTGTYLLRLQSESGDYVRKMLIK